MKFRFIWIGSNADPEFGAAVERYRLRIARFFPVDVVMLPPVRGRQSKDDQSVLRADSDRLVAALPSKGTTVVLDERGKAMDSLTFARWVENETVRNPYDLTFVMGGDVGFDDRVRQRADLLLSLSAMTLPHEMARVILFEQVYRACTLMRNIRYHK